MAAENFYGDVARQIAGPRAQVVSILQNPDADPHLFEPDAATARRVADANLLIYNGLNYDPWIERLLANARPTRACDAAGGRAAAAAHRAPIRTSGMTRRACPRWHERWPCSCSDSIPPTQAAMSGDCSAFLVSLRPLQTAIAQLQPTLCGRARHGHRTGGRTI